MRKVLTGLIAGAVMFGVSACGNPYAEGALTFRDTNNDGNCDVIEYQRRVRNWPGASTDIVRDSLDKEMTQAEIDADLKYKDARSITFADYCGAPEPSPVEMRIGGISRRL